MNAPVKKSAVSGATLQDAASVWNSIDTPVEYRGKAIVLPGDPQNMDFDSAIGTLERMKLMENQRYDVNEQVHGAPWDAVVAIAKAMHSIYGVVVAQSIQTFFGEIKPQLVTINTGHRPEDNIQVAIGQMSLPNMDKPVNIGMYQGGAFIVGTVRRKDRQALVDIANRARDIMRRESIYKGKAIILKVTEDGELNLDEQPVFIDLDSVSEADMIHTEQTEEMIQDNILTPLKHTEACRRHKMPLKRGILLSGKYGTGKSLTARVTAKVAVDNGWTFVMLDRAQGLKSAINFARTYQPAAIFAEDIDRCADRDDEAVNDLINTLDGLVTKDMEIMSILTTNFIENIDRALLRPGRFDAVIDIEAPDAPTAVRLMHFYGRSLIGADEDLSEVGEIIKGQVPATIREVVERSKSRMLAEGREYLTARDLRGAARTMANHMKLLEAPSDDETPAESFYNAFVELVRSAGGMETEEIEGLSEGMDGLKRNQMALGRALTSKTNEAIMAAQAAAGSAERASEVSIDALKTGQQTLDTAKKVLNRVS